MPILPASLDERTLRAEAAAPAEAALTHSRLVPVDPELDARRAVVDQERRALEDQLAALADQLRAADDRSANSQRFSAHLAALLNEEVRGAKPAPEVWKKSLESLREEDAAAQKQKIELAAQQRKLSRRHGLLLRKLEAYQATDRHSGLAVKVTVDCKGAASAAVKLSYLLPGATWRPEYDLRFVPDGAAKTGPGRVELGVSAVVLQATREDWTNVELVLSTAKPRLGGEAPYPATLWIDGYQAGKEKVLVQGRERRESLREGQAAEEAQGPALAQLDDRGTAVVLTLPHRASIASDGRPYWLPIDQAIGRGEVKLVTVPKLRPYVHQVVALANPATYPLLAGRVHVHRGGAYVGDAAFEYAAPGQRLEISLGPDEELAVERIDKRDVDRSPSFLGSTRRFERELRIKLSNRSTASQKIEVREAIPVSKVKDIEVEITKDKTTPGHKLDALRGIVTWTVEIPRGQERAVDLGYVIGLPKDWQVN
jgi:uncharacterized protein (TIGR02231 family)